MHFPRKHFQKLLVFEILRNEFRKIPITLEVTTTKNIVSILVEL